MAEFNFVQEAWYSPTWCIMCTSGDGPFVDTMLEQMPFATAEGPMCFDGHVYICMSCARQIGILAGLASPDDSSLLLSENSRLHAEAEQLRDELARERDNKVVNRPDFNEWLQESIMPQPQMIPAKRKPGRPPKNADSS